MQRTADFAGALCPHGASRGPRVLGAALLPRSLAPRASEGANRAGASIPEEPDLGQPSTLDARSTAHGRHSFDVSDPVPGLLGGSMWIWADRCVDEEASAIAVLPALAKRVIGGGRRARLGTLQHHTPRRRPHERCCRSTRRRAPDSYQVTAHEGHRARDQRQHTGGRTRTRSARTRSPACQHRRRRRGTLSESTPFPDAAGALQPGASGGARHRRATIQDHRRIQVGASRSSAARRRPGTFSYFQGAEARTRGYDRQLGPARLRGLRSPRPAGYERSRRRPRPRRSLESLARRVS